MANIVDYIDWRGDLSFEVDPLNSVDNLVFARLCYIDFDDIDSKGEELKTIAERYVGNENKMNPGILLNEGNVPLLQGVGKSNRFGSVKVKSFVSKLDKESQLQFSAVVFEIDRHTAYVAFRGTDDTIIGWKEDFNMAFMDVVPAQLEAKEYLEKVTEEHRYKILYVGGHSKGGNLSVFSSVYCDHNVKKRIVGVYSNDGPGFKHQLFETAEYQEIADKVETIVPESSVVGLLLEHSDNFKIVKSTEKGIMQHDCFSWNVIGRDFETLPELNDDAKFFDLTTKKVLAKLSMEERATFGDVLFDLLSVNSSETLTDLDKGGLTSLFKMSESYLKLDRETKKMVFNATVLFMDEGAKSFWEVSKLSEIEDRYTSWKSGVKKDIEEFFRR